ncbi:uncharacterized protein BJ171DRAFT_501772 [Polychytrium aggregatum]|uniref:uncharacterized protein n=1 Tax=Polychytrium aggregatum TaxID=110093 RepID=UPI0022FF1A64|nr:uncharacterized protein BJ171DRAFT_501772 [Polychytrium aggregatum]KAI9205322.1 hypothetical protein BJ171DRAFT_501772 [Polychytrium aggregatum]
MSPSPNAMTTFDNTAAAARDSLLRYFSHASAEPDPGTPAASAGMLADTEAALLRTNTILDRRQSDQLRQWISSHRTGFEGASEDDLRLLRIIDREISALAAEAAEFTPLTNRFGQYFRNLAADVLRQLHIRLWRFIECPAAALELLVLRGGTPTTLVRLAEFARSYASGAGSPSITWYDHILAGNLGSEDPLLVTLESKMRPPLKSPRATLEAWRQRLFERFGTHAEFARYMDSVASCRRVAEAVSAEPIIKAFADRELVRGHPGLNPEGLPAEPANLGQIDPYLSQVFVSLCTISMGMDELAILPADPDDGFAVGVQEIHQRIAPEQHSLLHTYPAEFRAMRKTRDQHDGRLRVFTFLDSLSEGQTELGRSLLSTRCCEPRLQHSGIARYEITKDYIGSNISPNCEDQDATNSLRISTYLLYEKAFGSGLLCGAAGTAWQMAVVYRAGFNNRPKATKDTVISFILAMWQYMGVLQHTRAEIVWAVANELEVSVLDVFLYFQELDARCIQ